MLKVPALLSFDQGVLGVAQTQVNLPPTACTLTHKAFLVIRSNLEGAKPHNRRISPWLQGPCQKL